MLLKNKKTAGLLLVLFTSFAYGTMPAVTQRAFQLGLSVETLLSSRFILGIIIIWSYVFFKKFSLKPNSKFIAVLLLLGTLQALVVTLLNESYKYLPGAIASLLVSLYVVTVVVIEIAIGRERLQLSKLGCVLLSSIGLVFIVWTPDGAISFHPLGVLFGCLAGLSYALFTIGLGMKKTTEMESEVVAAYILIPSSIFYILRCLAAHQPVFPQEASQWIYIVYLALISTFLANVCWCKAVKYIGSSNAALINTIEPLIAYTAGILLMSDVISLRATFGGVMILLAIGWLNLVEKKQHENTP